MILTCKLMTHGFRHWGLGKLGSLWLRHHYWFKVLRTFSAIGAGKEARLTSKIPYPAALVTDNQARAFQRVFQSIRDLEQNYENPNYTHFYLSTGQAF